MLLLTIVVMKGVKSEVLERSNLKLSYATSQKGNHLQNHFQK